MPARLVVFCGLPGVGKTAVSRRVADLLGATFLRIDTIEAAIASTLAPCRGNPVGLGWLTAEIGLGVVVAIVAQFTLFYPSRKAALRRMMQSYRARAPERATCPAQPSTSSTTLTNGNRVLAACVEDWSG